MRSRPKLKIAPSILASNFACIGEEIRRVTEAGADWLHIDVMDGHFVPNLTLGPQMVAAIRPLTSLPVDVHLMVTHPLAFVRPFAEAGANNLTFHVEVEADHDEIIETIRGAGARCGITLRPGTPIERVFPHFPRVDLLLIMTVEPGFGGQEFLPDSIGRIAAARAEAERLGLALDIEVDGGIDEDTAPRVIAAGANVLVAGTAVFGKRNVEAAIRRLRGNR